MHIRKYGARCDVQLNRSQRLHFHFCAIVWVLGMPNFMHWQVPFHSSIHKMEEFDSKIKTILRVCMRKFPFVVEKNKKICRKRMYFWRTILRNIVYLWIVSQIHTHAVKRVQFYWAPTKSPETGIAQTISSRIKWWYSFDLISCVCTIFQIPREIAKSISELWYVGVVAVAKGEIALQCILKEQNDSIGSSNILMAHLWS